MQYDHAPFYFSSKFRLAMDAGTSEGAKKAAQTRKAHGGGSWSRGGVMQKGRAPKEYPGEADHRQDIESRGGKITSTMRFPGKPHYHINWTDYDRQMTRKVDVKTGKMISEKERD